MRDSYPSPVVVIVAASALTGVVGCVTIDPPDPISTDVRYVAFGDSTTAGPSDRDYPDILREKLGVSTTAFANEGHGGETSEEGLERLTALIQRDAYPNADVLLYWEGGNDINDFIAGHDPLLLSSPEDDDYPLTDELTAELEQIQANIEAAIEAGRNAGMRVYAATYYLIPEEFDTCEALLLDIILPGQASNANGYVRLLNERIRSAVLNTWANLIDVETLDETLRGDSDNYENCNHLSAEGNEIVADLFAQYVP
ncbi:MAG: SGNH/GDSL hydrolase family protein [Phycisphaerales bacterium]|nr:MAG: SGNH/GDSL hydrolase family protein [Phycisphaerales bacterium]